MSERFLKFIPSEEAFWLIHNKPNAFRLLTHIANTARRNNGNPDGLIAGQCHLQHWKKYDLTEQEYRTAKNILVLRKHIIISETNRTRQKSTTGSTTGSTLVQLISSTVYDINSETPNDRINDRATTDQRLTNDKQEGIRKIKKEKEEEYAQPASRPRTNDPLKFNFEEMKFEGITAQDGENWRIAYPHVDLQQEIKRMGEWIIGNPSKSRKKNWRKFITGWFQRTNDQNENKKAYRSTSTGSLPDRRTKNMDGTPIKSKAEDLF